MFMHSITSVAPLLILIATGFCIARLPWCGKRGMNFLAKINMDIAIPPYLFLAVTTTYRNPGDLLELARNLRYPFLMTAIAIALALAAARLFRIMPPQRGVFINAVTFSNTVLMGMPVTVSLFGERAIPAAMIFYSANTLVFWTVGVWFLRRELDAGPGADVWTGVKRVLTGRPLAAFLVGVVWVLLGLPVPEFMARTFAMIGGVVTPISMIFIGCVIRFARFAGVGGLRELRLILCYRYTVVPLLAGLLCLVLPMDVLLKKVFFLLTNMPAMAQLPIVAKDVGSDYETASVAAAATTALSMAAVPVMMYFMESVRFLG